MGQILSILWEIVLFCDIWKICIMSRKILVCLKNFWTPKMVHWPKFFWWQGGGRSSKIIFSGKHFLALKAPTTSRFLIIWTWQLCTMAIRSLHGLSANFTLTPPLFKPPRYGPDCAFTLINTNPIVIQSGKSLKQNPSTFCPGYRQRYS
jgi:hypothetical protein